MRGLVCCATEKPQLYWYFRLKLFLSSQFIIVEIILIITESESLLCQKKNFLIYLSSLLERISFFQKLTVYFILLYFKIQNYDSYSLLLRNNTNFKKIFLWIGRQTVEQSKKTSTEKVNFITYSGYAPQEVSIMLSWTVNIVIFILCSDTDSSLWEHKIIIVTRIFWNYIFLNHFSFALNENNLSRNLTSWGKAWAVRPCAVSGPVELRWLPRCGWPSRTSGGFLEHFLARLVWPLG